MTTYFNEDGITLYHGDMREILPGLKGDILITDPPYGDEPGYDTGPGEARKGYLTLLETIGSADVDCKWVITKGMAVNLRIFLKWSETMGDSLKECAVWTKPNREQFEYLFGFWDKKDLEVALPESRTYSGNAEKNSIAFPEGLVRWLLFPYPKKGVVIDPCAGTGTTLAVAKELGWKAIGIEKREERCKIIKDRIKTIKPE